MFDKLREKLNSGSGADVPRDESEGSNDLFLWIIALVLLAFTAYRTAHLVSNTLPDDAKVMAFAALAALDFGALGWLAFANSTAGPRHGLALLMVALDLFGVGAAAIADTALVAGVNASIVENVALWAVPIIVLCNVAATFAAKALDPVRKARETERVRLARIEHARRRVLDEIEAAEREAELAMLRNRAALMRQRSAARMAERDFDDAEPGANGRKREMAADGAELPGASKSRAKR